MIWSKQKGCLLLTNVSTGSQKHTSVLQRKRAFSNMKYVSYKCWTCDEMCEAFTFLFENIIIMCKLCANWRHGKSTNSGDSYGHKLCSTHCELFFFCNERNFMSNLHKFKQYDLIDILNETSRYLDDIFIIDNPEFEKQIPSCYISNGTSVLQTKKLLSLI